MAGSFGTTGHQKWHDHDLVENHPRIRVGGLLGHAEIVVTTGDQQQSVKIESEWSFGRKPRRRPWFLCPSCNQRCRNLHERNGKWTCRTCSGLDWASRHRNRSRAIPTLNRARKGAGTPASALDRARARVAADELAALLRATVTALRGRTKRPVRCR